MIYLYVTVLTITLTVITSLVMEAYHQRRASEEVGDYDKHRH